MTSEDKKHGQWYPREMIDPLPHAPWHKVLRWILDKECPPGA